MLTKLRYLITSPPDRERLTVELWSENHMFAEVNYESETIKIEIYPNNPNQPWFLNLNDLMEILAKSKTELSLYDLK